MYQSMHHYISAISFGGNLNGAVNVQFKTVFSVSAIVFDLWQRPAVFFSRWPLFVGGRCFTGVCSLLRSIISQDG